MNSSTHELMDSPTHLWQVTWKRTAILAAVCIIPLMILARWQFALGVGLGALFLLGDIYLLKAPLEMMVSRVASNKRPWVMLVSLLRIVLAGAVLLILVKFRVANVFGLFVGVTLPVLAMASLFLTQGVTAWKV